MKRLFYYYFYLFLVWGSFRFFVRLPEVIEELWFKPIIWMTPLFWWSLSFKSKDRIKMFEGKMMISSLVGLLIGLAYLLLLKRFNFSNFSINLNLIGIVFATAITEELVFSGFVAGYLEKINKGRWINFLIVGIMTALLRLPILLFVFNPNAMEILGTLLFVAATSAIGAWIRVQTNNVAGSIFARMGIGLAVLG